MTKPEQDVTTCFEEIVKSLNITITTGVVGRNVILFYAKVFSYPSKIMHS